MIDHHVTTIFNTSSHHHQQIFHFHYLNVTTTSGLSISIHLEINPLDSTVAYLLVYRFDQLPQLNSSTDQIDGWTPLCPNSKSLSSNTNEREYYENTIDHKDGSILSRRSGVVLFWNIFTLLLKSSHSFPLSLSLFPQSLTKSNRCFVWIETNNENMYQYFLDNEQTSNHQSFVFGLRELNASEIIDVCSSTFNNTHRPPIMDEPFNFTSDYRLRIYTSGCYYLDEHQQWKSDGLIVSRDYWTERKKEFFSRNQRLDPKQIFIKLNVSSMVINKRRFLQRQSIWTEFPPDIRHF